MSTEPLPITVSGLESIEALRLIQDRRGWTFPYKILPGSRPGTQTAFITKEQWDAYQYNPPQHFPDRYPDPDPQADPKPSWNLILEMVSQVRIFGVIKRSEYRIQDFEHDRDLLPNIAPTHEDGSSVHIGREGVNRMAGLHYQHSRAADAGIVLRRSVLLQDDRGQTVDLWTRRQFANLLDQAAGEHDLIESAKNIVISRMVGVANEAKKYLDLSQLGSEYTKEELLAFQRQAQEKSDQLNGLIRSSPDDVLKEIERLRNDNSLPDDLPTLKGFLIERLEGTATAKMKALKFAESQNGVDLHAACDDEGIAHTEIAAEKKKGQIRIERAQTIEAAKKAGEAATKAINGVKALRTPVFHKFTTATNSERIHGDSVTYKETSVKIRAQHPTWRESRLAIPGEVSMFGHVETNAEGVIPEGAFLDFQVPETPSALGEMDVTLSAKAGVRTEYRLTARSLCGPSLLTVILDPPAKDEAAS